VIAQFVPCAERNKSVHPRETICRPQTLSLSKVQFHLREAQMKNFMPVIFALVPLVAVVSACVAVH
jgi:hypothetical protein